MTSSLDDFAASRPPKHTRCRVCLSGRAAEVNAGREKGYTYQILADWLEAVEGGPNWYHNVKNHFFSGHARRG